MTASPPSSADSSPASHATADSSGAAVDPYAAADPPTAITRDEVAHLARLARLSLDEAELDRFGGQLDAIVHAISRIGDLDTAGVPPTSHALALTNVTRPDVVRPSLTQAQALSGAPAAEDGWFRVPRILEDEA